MHKIEASYHICPSACDACLHVQVLQDAVPQKWLFQVRGLCKVHGQYSPKVLTATPRPLLTISVGS